MATAADVQVTEKIGKLKVKSSNANENNLDNNSLEYGLPLQEVYKLGLSFCKGEFFKYLFK